MIFPTQSHRLAVLGFASAALMAGPPPALAGQPTLDEARAAFYNANFDQAAEISLEPCTAGDIDACEIRSAAILMEIKRQIGPAKDKEKALKACEKCNVLLPEFFRDTAKGQVAARARVKANPTDEAAQFLLGKLDLNYVWLQLGTLGRKTGWNEYWEARHTLDDILEKHPENVRAKVARAWIDYIVDTRMPRGTRWVLGGGNRKRAIVALREAAVADTDTFTSAEARFGLWDVLAREKNFPEAVVVARALAKDFPGNSDLPKFLAEHDAAAPPPE